LLLSGCQWKTMDANMNRNGGWAKSEYTVEPDDRFDWSVL
jgi:hypothetical protein